MDPRIKELSELLVNYSCDIQPGDKVLISYEGECCKNLARQLIKDVYKAGGLPYSEIRDAAITREILLNCTEEQIMFKDKCDLDQMKGMQAYIAIRAGNNTAELADVPSEKLNLYSKLSRPTLDYRVNETKWVVLRYPNYSMAQLANTSLENFEDFYFDVCTLDYRKMSEAMTPLVDLMNRTDKVQIKGPGTDLTFSIKGIGAVKCDGLRNIPDGEVYTAPVRESMNGIISYNTPSEEQGFTYENIVFQVENGKIVKATANDTKKINDLLDVDEGARYFGEFAIGVNPYILHPMKDTLFDEKIAGSFHLTPGMCYEDAPNGNKSANHWDLVMIQRPEYGGGEIWFDDVLIRKDGIFVLPELEGLNPENLK
ncbi:MAG: aminopeptidase [Bacillota bacterium]|nr:aminopeptidase [Bacillota bacterium]MDD7131283.1 aminopeptidase [Bacillota bacterium]MDO4472456.1 aminopeptidase [Bacillota bacterium]MDY5607112.1 aminopeptidase [Lentihominibacter sp.]MDY6174582.1 aminopeptidase [Lentihominibacter sp.]